MQSASIRYSYCRNHVFTFHFSPFTFNQLDRNTTLQALEQTLNKIFLLNNGAKVIADYSNEEESTGMVAEGEE